MAKKLSDNEVQDFLLASFVQSDDPTKVWIGDIKRTGKDRWLAYQKQRQSMSYLVEQDLSSMAEYMAAQRYSLNDLFAPLGSHPPLLRLYVKGNVSLETMVVMDICLGYSKIWDKKMSDPLWESMSMKMRKYKPFLSINTNKYKKMMQETFL